VVKQVKRALVLVMQAVREDGVGVLRACRALEGASSVYVLEHALHGTRASLLEQLTSDAALLDASRDLLQLPAGECLLVLSCGVHFTQQSAIWFIATQALRSYEILAAGLQSAACGQSVKKGCSLASIVRIARHASAQSSTGACQLTPFA